MLEPPQIRTESHHLEIFLQMNGTNALTLLAAIALSMSVLHADPQEASATAGRALRSWGVSAAAVQAVRQQSSLVREIEQASAVASEPAAGIVGRVNRSVNREIERIEGSPLTVARAELHRLRQVALAPIDAQAEADLALARQRFERADTAEEVEAAQTAVRELLRIQLHERALAAAALAEAAK